MRTHIIITVSSENSSFERTKRLRIQSTVLTLLGTLTAGATSAFESSISSFVRYTCTTTRVTDCLLSLYTTYR